MIATLSPEHWTDYALIDAGHFQKLERFGAYTLIRPEPQAVWPPALPMQEWLRQAHASFVPEGSNKGQWQQHKKMPDNWQLNYKGPGYSLRFKLALTAFKHVGVFPEQAANWDFAHARCLAMPKPKVLNLFAYTGGASLAACAAGAAVTHVDSVKQVVGWANENMQLSSLADIRWIVEDALKFVQREVRRGAVYQGILLDPPAYGHGAKGERWKLEDMIDEMVQAISKLLAPEEGFLVFNCYSLGFSSLILQRLIGAHMPWLLPRLQLAELCLRDAKGQVLPTGVIARG